MSSDTDTIKNYEPGIPLAEDEFSDLDEGCDPFLFSKDGPDGTFCQLSDTNNNEDDTEGGFSSSTENENDCKVRKRTQPLQQIICLHVSSNGLSYAGRQILIKYSKGADSVRLLSQDLMRPQNPHLCKIS